MGNERRGATVPETISAIIMVFPDRDRGVGTKFQSKKGVIENASAEPIRFRERDGKGRDASPKIKEEKRVDELPGIMEANPLKALLVEKIKHSEFQFLANAYCNQDQYAWAMGCRKTETGLKMAERATQRIKPQLVTTAPCKEVILKGGDVDVTRLPMFLHHDRDGNAYTNDNLVVTRDPDTGIHDWGIYRSMFCTKDETEFRHDLRVAPRPGKCHEGQGERRESYGNPVPYEIRPFASLEQGLDGPMLTERPPFRNVAVMADNDRMYQCIGRVGEPNANVPRITGAAEIRPVGGGAWAIVRMAKRVPHIRLTLFVPLSSAKLTSKLRRISSY